MNSKLIDTTGKVICKGDTLLVYSPYEERWSTEIADIIDDKLYSIWETTNKRVSTPIEKIEQNHIVILISDKRNAFTDLPITPKKRIVWES